MATDDPTLNLIQQGVWRSHARGYALGNTSKGNPQVGVDFELLEGPDAGRHITWYGYFTDATFDRTVESLRLCGWIGDDLDNLQGIDTNDVMLVIEHEPDQDGVIRARVRWVNAIGGVAMANRFDADAARSFAQRMKGRVMALKQGGGNAATPQPRPATAPASASKDDDIPF